MGDTRNWYFRVHEKFFSDKEIRKIELLPQSRYGIHFPSFVIHLYMKMLCYSVSENGFIILEKKDCDSDNISYPIAKAFMDITEQPYVEQALKVLMEKGLIEIVDDINYTSIFMEKLPAYIGSVTDSSEKRQQRRLAAKNNKQLRLENKNTEDKSGERKKEKKNVYGHMENVYLTKSEYKSLSNINDFEKILGKYSVKKATQQTLNKTSENIDDYEELKKILSPDENDNSDSDMEF